MNSYTEVVFSSKTDNWATPQWLFDQLNEEFHFTLDVCADSQNAKCGHYFTREQDGLSQKWEGRVWCNPPYGRTVGNWVKKAAEFVANGGGLAVMLLPARTDTRWFHTYIYGKAEIRFIKGRLRFGNATENAPFPSMIVIFRGGTNNAGTH